MPGAHGLRVAMLAAGLVAVAVLAAVAGWSPGTIVVVMAVAFVVASTIEVLASSREREERVPDEQAPKTRDDLTERVRVFELEPADEPVETMTEEPEAEREPETEAEEPEPDEAAHEEPEAERPKQPAAPEPEPKREAERLPLVALPAPPPRPEPVPPKREPEPAEPPVVVSLAARDTRVREWNLWELERLARERAGEDPVRDEERNYLLMYMREFATPDGLLPPDFDALVRDSFGDLLAALPQ